MLEVLEDVGHVIVGVYRWERENRCCRLDEDRMFHVVLFEENLLGLLYSVWDRGGGT